MGKHCKTEWEWKWDNWVTVPSGTCPFTAMPFTITGSRRTLPKVQILQARNMIRIG